MSLPATQGYEWLRATIANLPAAGTPDDRDLVWADATHALAVARDPENRLEVFIVGDRLEALDPVVASNIVHQVWKSAVGEPLPANRLVLPAAQHFDGVAAFICCELLEHGADIDPVEAFRRSEPVIALALRRAALSNQALVGLAGELFVLAELVGCLPHRALQLVGGWCGSVPSSRDLQLGPVGVEIKTTTGGDSVHHIQGIHQIEPGVGVDDMPETHLFLLSIGVQWLHADESAGRSIPDLVEAIIGTLPDTQMAAEFLARVKQYGGDAAAGYDHTSQSTVARFRRRFRTRFERLYDLSDDRLRLVRGENVEHAAHVEIDSIAFRVRLPRKVRGDINPVHGMPAVADHLERILSAPGAP